MGALEHCEVCRCFEKAPHVSIEGASTVSTLDGKLQVDILFLNDLIASRAMDVSPGYSLLIPARPKSLLGVPGALRRTGLAFFYSE